MCRISRICSIVTALAVIISFTLPAQAFHEQVYTKGNTRVLPEAVCTTKAALLEIHNALKKNWGAATIAYGIKEDAEICTFDIEATVGDQFGDTVTIIINKEMPAFTFFMFEAIRASDGKRVYAIARGTYQDIKQ